MNDYEVEIQMKMRVKAKDSRAAAEVAETHPPGVYIDAVSFLIQTPKQVPTIISVRKL